MSHFIHKQVTSVKVALLTKVNFGTRLCQISIEFEREYLKIFQRALNICFHKDVHSSGDYISRFIYKQVTSIKIAVASKDG